MGVLKEIGRATHCALALGILLSTAVRAGDAQTTQSAEPDCACYAQGQRFAQKQIVCIRGQRMMCGMSSNVSSWISTNEDCQISFHHSNYGLTPRL